MTHESYIFESLLEKNVKIEDCKQWLLDPNYEPPDGMFDGFGWDVNDREAFRKELPLLLINFIRGQSAKILHTSQDCSKTPAKPTHPSKYDYKSPIKTLHPTETSNQKRGSKKRVQLFASPIKDNSRSTQLTQSNFESSDSVSIPDDFIKLKLTDRNEAKIETLNERISARDYLNTPKLKIALTTSKPVRKSLDLPNPPSHNHWTPTGQPSHSYTPQNGRNHSGGLSLGDFIVKSSSGSKKSRGKNRNRKSDSALLNLKSESPRSSMPPSLGQKELAELESSPLTERLIKKSSNVSSIPVVSSTERQQAENNEAKTNFSMENSICDETKNSSTEKTPLKVLKFNLEDNPEEDFSPLKKFIRPDFKENSNLSKDLIEPDPSKVTHTLKLAQLSSLYSFLIDKHLVPNVLVEMYLLLELLTVKARNEDNDISGFFNTVHNAVFFATEVIKQQVDLFKFVDVLTLKYLVSNPRLELFCPEVKQKLDGFLAISANRPADVHPSVPNNHLHSVRFQTDTDAKENFPNLNTFQDFKKQRDLFYNILRDWQHKTSGSEIPPHEVFVPRASKLLSLQSHPVNMIHFSKLFQDQLITMSLAEMNSLDGNDAAKHAESSIVRKLETLDPEHWRKIQAKTYIPTRFGGPCPAPDFPGCQEFFRDFIRYCDGHLPFIAHLKLTFVRTITETTDKIIADRNRQQSSSIQSHSDYLTQDNCWSSEDIFNSVLSLRIVGKFLGFLEFLPYHFQPNLVSEKILALTMQARDKETPCIDVYDQLEKAEKSGNLVLTVPWIIEFCSVMDSISVKLPYYKMLFKKLVFVYMDILVHNPKSDVKDQNMPLAEDTEDQGTQISPLMTNFNAFFLTIHMGWFFEGALFPRELFLLNSSQNQVESHTPAPCGLDNQNYVSPTLLYACCPYLNELMAILTQFETGFKTHRTQATEHLKAENENRESKLFRSVEKNPSREHSDIDRAKTLSELQAELEENFFHNQSNSVRKCVESVAELVASKIARMIARDVIDPEILRVSRELQANLAVFLAEMTDSSMVQTIKAEMLSQVMDFSEKSYEDVREKVNGIVSEKVSESCSTAVRLLLPDDTNQTVAELCVLVAQKKTLMFITARVKKNVTKNFFEKEYGREFEKFWRAALKRATDGSLKEPTMLPKVTIDEEASTSDDLFTCHVLVKIKDQIVEAIETKGASHQFTESVLDLMCQLETSLAQEIIFYGDNSLEYEQTLKGVESLTVDWAIILCAFLPSLFTAEFQDALVAFWGGPRVNTKGTHVSLSQPPSQLLSILSPRNMTFFGESPKPIETWRKFENFLGRLLSANLVLPEAMEDQSIRLLKSDWPLATLRRLASCLNGIVSTLRAKPGFKNQDFLEWTAWFCAEVAEDDDGYNGNDDFFPSL